MYGAALLPVNSIRQLVDERVERLRQVSGQSSVVSDRSIIHLDALNVEGSFISDAVRCVTASYGACGAVRHRMRHRRYRIQYE